MNFILTGHKGLIGSFLLKALIERGDKPILLIDKRDGKNVLDIDKEQINEKVDMFIHLADFCKINKTILQPELAFENSRGMEKVLEFCRNNKIPKVIYTSSSRVLSKERNPYTASKLYGEELLKAYCKCYGISYVIIRPSTVYGPFDDKTSRLVDIWILAALKRNELKIFGDENKTLDFTYIDDFIQGFQLAMAQENEDYNIAYGKGIKLIKVADYIIHLAGKGFRNFYPAEIEQPQEVELDISDMKNLGYNPQVDIEQGLKKTFDWYKENLDKLER
ncbi:MAG: NAD-dependent epimerase/dehydratase family protein [Candidatus Pacearchaeota archaeon]|nr:NAD-dependent epimerase/dehydratase family protein [Candidatus Pacearchaeota archaeon]